jgi:hypothetical protein
MQDAGGGRGAPSVRQKVLASITFGDGRSVSVAFVIKRTILCKVARNCLAGVRGLEVRRETGKE